MTFIQLAGKNALRKPIRTLLLVICVAVAFLIYGLTASFLQGTQGTAGASESLLGVMSAAGRHQTLPIALKGRIAADPGVAMVTYMTRLRGFVDSERNVAAVSAVVPRELLQVNGRELALTPTLIDALNQAQDRVLVGRALAEAQGWSTGQSITLTAFETFRQDGSRHWRFEIAGIFEGESASTDTYFMLAHYDYINLTRARGKDTVNAFVVRPREGIAAGELAARIDRLFANSAHPTRTQSEKQFLEAFLRQYADVGLIVNIIVGASFVTLLMIIINTMLFAVRERTFEIGVLKTLGFPSLAILALILAETLLIFTVGGALGLTLTKIATTVTGPQLGLVFSLPVLAEATALILALGLATGALPAYRALRIPVTTAFTTR